MIVRETSESFILITQHDHATVSGQLAELWAEDFFWKQAYVPETLLAIYQHDRGWIPLDAVPAWDAQQQKVFSFIGYPPTEKLNQYTQGIDEVEAMNPYAAILCSRHYCSFMNGSNVVEKDFIEQEFKRQARLKQAVHVNGTEKEALLSYHFRLLQLFDDLSLYLCMNHPGVSKKDEFPFFRNGFKNSEKFAFTGGKKIEAFWKDVHTIAVLPFPLSQACTVSLPYKELSKIHINEHGLGKAYQEASLQTYEFAIEP
jgi:hypothetical protein